MTEQHDARDGRTPVLVAGAAGRLGRQVVVDLVATGRRVAAVDRDRKRLEALLAECGPEGIEAFPCELGDEAAVTRLASEVDSPLAVVDLTGEIIEDSTDHAACTAQVVATLHLIAALGPGVERAVFGSCHTVENARPDGTPLPARPDSYHGAARLAGEKLWRLFGRNNDIPVTVLRLSPLDAGGATERASAAVIQALANGGGVVDVA